MSRRLLHLYLAAGITLLLCGCSSKNSEEACIHKVTMDLDKGEYEAVLASVCADPMQRAAAYFGRAGYDGNAVLNTFVRTGVTSGQTATQSDLKVYMTSLIGTVNERSLADLDSSAARYNSIPATSEPYRDAQFYVSLVDMVKGLALLKLISSDVTGTLNTSCDVNSNTVVDGADASSCALTAASNISTNPATPQSCNQAAYARSSPLDITFPGKSGIYSGLFVTLNGTDAVSCPTVFKKLLYKDAAARYFVAVTASDQQCTASDDTAWPCPIEVNGQPLDLVNAFNASVNSSVDSLNNSVTTTSGSNADVQRAILDVKTQACPAGTCTSTDIASYLQTIK